MRAVVFYQNTVDGFIIIWIENRRWDAALEFASEAPAHTTVCEPWKQLIVLLLGQADAAVMEIRTKSAKADQKCKLIVEQILIKDTAVN